MSYELRAMSKLIPTLAGPTLENWCVNMALPRNVGA
jgi:hypothetical protein